MLTVTAEWHATPLGESAATILHQPSGFKVISLQTVLESDGWTKATFVVELLDVPLASRQYMINLWYRQIELSVCGCHGISTATEPEKVRARLVRRSTSRAPFHHRLRGPQVWAPTAALSTRRTRWIHCPRTGRGAVSYAGDPAAQGRGSGLR
jgi:hypothetical protein